ncbi:MAG: hypothetical protein K9G46_08255 [Flavobacteriales bacterium]|jgi:hypothetical protein|nr:hypothetical protein [Flavobacteriales bacterium]
MKINDLSNRIAEGCKLSFARLLQEKKRNGRKLVTIIEGAIVELTVEEYERMKTEGRI